MKIGTLALTVTVMYPSPTDFAGQPVPDPGAVPGATVVLTDVSSPLACDTAAHTGLPAAGQVAPGPTAVELPLTT